ncbi:MAG: hypothetical protein HYU30_10725 [Chloroflexi bacterium]|nr:hypothetical protein [Chloroflexota bacterium]
MLKQPLPPFLSALAGALLLAFTLSLASAQEPGETPPLETAGPYQVAVTTVTLEPLVADVRFFVWLLDGVTGEPVAEAQVRIRTRNQATGQEGWAFALSTPQQPHLYRANVHFEGQGVWDSVVEVSSSLGDAEMPGPSSVVHFEESSAVGGYAFLVTALMIIGGALYVTWRIRQAQSRRSRDQTPSAGTPLSIPQS